jgi:hypothetical protein
MRSRIITPDFPLFLPPPVTPRSDGVHVSSIIRCIATEAGILKPEQAEELSLVDVRQITDPTAILRMSIGLAIEEWYIPKILSRYGVIDHPGEMLFDGVYMSHDAEDLSVIITLQQLAMRVHEVKATYKSTKTVGDLTDERNWMWLAQIKAYCLALGTRFAVLHVWFINGDYTWPMRPHREVRELEFTQEELEDNWQDLKAYERRFNHGY